MSTSRVVKAVALFLGLFAAASASKAVPEYVWCCLSPETMACEFVPIADCDGGGWTSEAVCEQSSMCGC